MGVKLIQPAVYVPTCDHCQRDAAQLASVSKNITQGGVKVQVQLNIANLGQSANPTLTVNTFFVILGDVCDDCKNLSIAQLPKGAVIVSGV